jgi:hypothetical protein
MTVVQSGSLGIRYSAVTFAATLANMLAVELGTWVFAPYFMLAVFTAPLLLVDLAVALFLVRRPGRSGQIGRGMLIGWISVPLSAIAFLSIVLIAS